ncbi:hypothetical protein RQP46_005863 [Phenoliferia psychrophenolica]
MLRKLNVDTLLGNILSRDFLEENIVPVSAGVAAFATHLLAQYRQPHILFVLIAGLLSTIATPVSLIYLGDYSLASALYSTGVAATSYIATLTSSIIIYRLFFHRLRRFPGPKLASITKLWNVALCVDGHTPWRIAELHRKHGDFLRIGPNELSVLNPAAITQVHGVAAKMTKGDWYACTFTDKGESVFSIRGLKEHSERRKYWDRAFGAKPLADYMNFVRECGEEWIEQLTNMAKAGTVVNMTDWSIFLTFDVMGIAAFGESFGLVKSGKGNFYVSTLERALHAATIVGEIPWLIPLIMSLPLGREQKDLYDFSLEMTLKRLKRGDVAARRDTFHYLVGENQETKAHRNIWEMDADTRLLIITGSDTVASTMSFVLYYLAMNPEWMTKLQAEVEFFRVKTLEGSELARLKVLNAIIHETQRLKTVVPSKAPRVVPQGGAVICGEFIPGGTRISVPMQATHHDPRNFSPAPLAWRPDRWLFPEKEEAMNQKAFIPFSLGAYSCAGKVLAQLELRVFLTMFALHFDVKLADGFDVPKYEDSILDRFTVQKGPLDLVLTPRAI